MTNVPAVTTKHSQPGSVADNIPAEELVLFEVLRGLAVEVEAVVVLVLVADVVLDPMDGDVKMTPLRIVEVVVQEDDLGIG